ncbi:MAG: Calx-beta domain-containing protein [Microcoleus sp.]
MSDLNSQVSALIPYQIDLKTGKVIGQSNSFISLVNPPSDSNRDSWLEASVKIQFNGNVKKAKLIVEYEKKPSGWTVNLGDSPSNNGYGGDASTQSRDAEMQIVNQNLAVFGNDYNTPAGGELTQGKVPNFVNNSSRVELEISNEQLTWDNKKGIKNTLSSPYLYAIKNQPDATGAINSEIYAGFNRVISGPGNRIGSGANKVTILLNPIDYTINANFPTVKEGNSGTTEVAFVVNRSGCIELSSNINYAIAGTATNGSDYNNIGGKSGATGATGTINFAAGETSQTITIDILADRAIEPDETIEITLSNPSGLDATPTIITAVATITVTDDDRAGIAINPAGLITPATGSKGNFTAKQQSEQNTDFYVDLSSFTSVDGKLLTVSYSLIILVLILLSLLKYGKTFRY